MEASTGQVIYEKNASEQLHPASITKIMTLILIFDALARGELSLADEVATSARARHMTGSKVFLEEGELQTVETMIKCIVIASGNDASVAMAEHIAGSEEEFVRRMNERAAGLSMTGTNFVDCCGLTDSPEHYTTALDVARMSRELITKYPQIKAYSTIWMENITHVTRAGSKEFTLSNTNKLLKMTSPFTVTGLKTGSTSLAKYCVSATAEKDGIELIAVIMAAPDYKIRFPEAQTLLTYGYANCRLYRDTAAEREPLPCLPVVDGTKEEVAIDYETEFSYLGLKGEDFSSIEKVPELPQTVQAPVREGDAVGRLIYYLDGRELGEVHLVARESVDAAGYLDYLNSLWRSWMVG